MKTYSPEELIRVPVQCTCGKDMELSYPMRARREELLMIIKCPVCGKEGALQLRIVDKIPDEIVTTFIQAIHSGENDAEKENIPC